MVEIEVRTRYSMALYVSRRSRSQNRFFSALSEPELTALALRASVRACQAGEILFSEGGPCSGLYIVAKGRVRIFKISPAGREQVLALEGPGGSVAELPVFDGGPYPASGAAQESSELLFISRRDFQAFCLEHPGSGAQGTAGCRSAPAAAHGHYRGTVFQHGSPSADFLDSTPLASRFIAIEGPELRVLDHAGLEAELASVI